MKIFAFRPCALLLAALLGTVGSPALLTARVAAADAVAPNAATSTDEHGADWETEDQDADHDSTAKRDQQGSRHHHHVTAKPGNEVVNVGADSVLEAGKEAEQVVAVFGNVLDAGTVHDDVVAVFGSSEIDGKVGGDAVSVFGNVTLGPHAEIDGDVVTVFGKLRRDPAAIVHGDARSVFGHDFAAPSGLRSWFEECLMYGRPLALAHGLGWAWGLALSLLALYLCIALVFRSGVERCVTTFEQHPGPSVLAALLTVLLTPVLIVLLCITVIGVAAVPFAVIGLFCVSLFGKAVILAWLGSRVLRLRSGGATGAPGGAGAATPGAATPGALATPHPALAVCIGGAIALALYLVPFFGFVFYKLLGFLGLGAVIYTAILGLRARQAARNGGPSPAGAAGFTPAAGAYAAAAVPPAEVTENSISAPPPNAAPLSPTELAALPRAGFWIRMVALLLDVLLVGVLTHLLHTVSDVHVVLLAAYGAIMWKLRGCTVGGIVFDLRVVQLDGRAMDWQTAIIRALSCFLSLAVAGLGFFWIAFDPANQAWHDKIAGTVVVRVPKALPGA